MGGSFSVSFACVIFYSEIISNLKSCKNSIKNLLQPSRRVLVFILPYLNYHSFCRHDINRDRYRKNSFEYRKNHLRVI